MKWSELNIQGYGNVLVTPIQPQGIEVSEEYYDEDGNILTKEYKKGETAFKNPDGLIVEKTYKKVKVNGEWVLLDKFQATKEIKKAEEVDRLEVFEVIPEKSYYAKNESLFKELKQKNKALKFRYSTGNGYQCLYDAFITPFQDRLVMILGMDYYSKVFERIENNIQERKTKTEKVVAKKVLSANELLI